MGDSGAPKKRNVILTTALAGVKGIALFLILYVGILYLTQDMVVYHPRSYEANAQAIKGRTLVRLNYETSSGRQVAFYLPPADGRMPDRLWIMFGGNGGLILQYADGLPSQQSLQKDGFLLIDYPGYGYNQGKPSDASIQEGADAAFVTLVTQLGIDQKTLLARSGLVGHSLGTGVALEFAVAHPEIGRIVLVAPFTSLYDMAFRTAGPAAHLLHHNFDNAAILHQLATRNPMPQVVIFTGDRDQIIPVDMSRQLARDNPWLTYHELPGYEHNQIVAHAASQIAAAMAGLR